MGMYKRKRKLVTNVWRVTDEASGAVSALKVFPVYDRKGKKVWELDTAETVLGSQSGKNAGDSALILVRGVARLEFGSSPNGWGLIWTDYGDAGSLCDYSRKRRQESRSHGGAGLTWLECCSYSVDAVKGVKECHDIGCIHCDLKPHNFVGIKKGNSVEWKLTDFGSARPRAELWKLQRWPYPLTTPVFEPPEAGKAYDSIQYEGVAKEQLLRK